MILLYRLMLTCATHHSTNLCWYSSQIWKPSKWPSASPVWSSRPWQTSVECSVSFFLFWLECASLLARNIFVWCKIKTHLPSIFSLIAHTSSLSLHFRHQEIRGTVPAEATRWSIQEEEEERQELTTWWHLGYRFTQWWTRRCRWAPWL